MATELVPHFFRSFAEGLARKLCISKCKVKNNHHMVEAMFKPWAELYASHPKNGEVCPYQRCPMIAIVKGCGANFASIQFALERLGKPQS